MADAKAVVAERKGRGISGDALALVLLIAAMLIFSWRAYDAMVPTFYGLADEHGYLTTAKRLATNGEFVQRQSDPYAFIGETMMQSAGDATAYYLRQPIGYPVLCAVAYFFGGSEAPFAVNPLLGLALIGGVYVVGKELGSRMLGAVAGLVIALHPLVLYYTVMALSHIPDMAAGTWAMAFALMWRRERRVWQAVGGGLLLGAAVMIRYTNVLLLLPLGVVVLQRWHAGGTARRGMLRDVGIAGGVFVVMLVPLAIYQAVAFGGILRTGYSAGGNATSFSWGWLVAHAPAMGAILWQPGMGLNVLLIGAAVGIVVMAVKDRWTLALLLAWAIPPLVVYTAYYGMPARNTVLYARFALCGFVPLILLGTMWSVWMSRGRMKATVSAIILAAAAMGWNVVDPFMAKQLTELNDQMLFTFSTRDLVKKDVPPGSVVLADDFTYYFLDYAGDYTIYNPAMYRATSVQARLEDLEHSPHEYDPARTRQLATLFGGKSNAELAVLLRERLNKAAENGSGVYLVTLQNDVAGWAKLLRARLEPQEANILSLGVYRVTFPETATSDGAALSGK
jgi:4-amino-4-deoxy-L-arabinose transferase-like glycosyltransferase